MFSPFLITLCVIYAIMKLIRSLGVKRLNQKHVVITGCDSGFGKMLALKLDTLGLHVHAGCLTESGQENLTQEASSRLKTFSVDVTNPDSIRQAYDHLAPLLQSGLWALVNNAGISGVEAPIEMCSMDDFDYTMKVNLFGHINMIKTFLPLIRKCKGRVVNITSVAGRLACITAPYCVSKFAFEGFSDCLRRELSEFGVKVSIVEPGLFKTDILNTEAASQRSKVAYDSSSEEIRMAYGKNFVAKMGKQYKNLVNQASESRHKVVNAYVHAVTALFPKSRYVVGNDANFVLIPATFLPDWLTDPVIKRIKNKLE